MDTQKPSLSLIVEEDESSQGVVQNSLIVSQILSYLPLSDIKNMRQVSCIWNQESIKILKKKTLINFQIDENYNGHVFTENYAKFFNSCMLMGKCGGLNSISTWKVTLPSFHPFYSTHCIQDKLYHEIHFFLHQDFGLVQWITVLNLDITAHWVFDFQILFNVLEEFQSTLQELHISGYYGVDKAETYHCIVDFSFPRLQKFTCFVRVSENDVEDDSFISLGDWWNSIIIGTKQVQYLKVGNGFKEGFFLPRLSAFNHLKEIEFEKTSVNVIKTWLTQEQVGEIKILSKVSH